MLRRNKGIHRLGVRLFYQHHPIITQQISNSNSIEKPEILVFGTTTSLSLSSMADNNKKTATQQTPTAEDKEETEMRKKKELEMPEPEPEPPEKPEAGDCCGSGCVRCVWDVYYDQLDEYNRLLHQFNKRPHPDPPK